VKVQVSTDDINYVDAITGVTGALDMDMIFAATKNGALLFASSPRWIMRAGHWWTVTDLNIDL